MAAGSGEGRIRILIGYNVAMENHSNTQMTGLSNGMRLVTVAMPGINSVTVLVMVGVGSRFEKKEEAGISHFLEHLPFKGTKNYPTPMAVAEAIDNIGGKHNAFTSKEYTGYWVKVDSSHLPVALDVVSDLLLTPKLDEEDIERERGVILEEINMYEDEPQYKVSSVFDGLIFNKSALAMDTLGTKQTVRKITKADFLQHYQTWYDPTNVVIGVVGKITDDGLRITEMVEEYFSKGEARIGGGIKTIGVKKQLEPRIKVFYKKTEQAHFYLGYPAIGWSDPGRYALLILSTILGGNSSSWLFNEIREKRGLAYYAYASNDMYQETGSLYALEGVALNKIKEAIKVTLSEFEKAVDGRSIDDKAVERAKEYLMGKMSLDLEDSASMANLVVRKALLEGEVVTLAEIIKRIRAVNRDQVMEIAREIMVPERLNLAIVGPYKNSQEFEGLIS